MGEHYLEVGTSAKQIDKINLIDRASAPLSPRPLFSKGLRWLSEVENKPQLVIFIYVHLLIECPNCSKMQKIKSSFLEFRNYLCHG